MSHLRLKSIRTFLWLLCLTGCATSTGLGGCSERMEGEFQETSTNVVPSGVFAALSQAGVDFLIDNRETLVALLLSVGDDGWATIEVPEITFGEDELTAKTKDLRLGIDLRNAQIDMRLSGQPFRISVQIKRASLRVDDGAVEIRSTNEFGLCELLNGQDVMTPFERVTTVDLGLIVTPQLTPSGQIDVDITVVPEELVIDRPSIGFRSDTDAIACRDGSCEFVCDTTNFLSELVNVIYDDFGETIGETLAPILNERIDEELSEISEAQLLLDGQFFPTASSTVFPADAEQIDFRFRPSSTGFEFLSTGSEAGVGLGVNIGLDSPNHPCVPVLSGDKLFEAGPRPPVNQIAPSDSQSHAALAISEATINRGLWSAWRSGMMCILLDSQQLKSLTETDVDTSTLGVFFASLGLLTSEPRPIMVALDPRFSPEKFPLLSFIGATETTQIPTVDLALNLPDIGIDIYAFINGAWTRLLGVATSVNLAVQVQRLDSVKLGMAIDVPTISDVSVTYSEILMADDIPKLLEVVVDLAIASLSDDALSVDFDLDGLLESALGLPYELVISDLSVTGAQQDHLGVALRIDPTTPGMPLTASLKTNATIIGAGDDWVEVDIDDADHSDVGYQWRLHGGPWRPIRRPTHDVLRIVEPRLRIDDEHLLDLRAVDLTPMQRRASQPITLTVPKLADRKMIERPVETQSSGTGCSTTASRTIFASGPLYLFLGLLFGARAIRRRRLWIVFASSLSLFGCDNSDPSSDLPCEIDQDCPKGRVCADDVCILTRRCQTEADCCGQQTCREGQCEEIASDGCTLSSVPCAAHETCIDDTCVAQICDDEKPCQSGAVCTEGACISGLLCDGRCAPDEACWLYRNVCRPKPETCQLSCEDGAVAVIANAHQFDQSQCALDQLRCVCHPVQTRASRSVARQFDMDMDNGRVVALSYEPQLGDLVYINDLIDDPEDTLTLDGFEQNVGGILSTDQDRNGQRLAGPDRGRFPQIKVDDAGRIHGVYLDRSANVLRYIRREPDGTWRTPIIFDEVGVDFGGLVLRLGPQGRLHLAYQFLDADGAHQLRYALAPSTASEALDFAKYNLDVVPAGLETRDDPTTLGLLSQPCLTVFEDTAVIGYRDPIRGKFYLSRGNLAGFTTDELVMVQSEFANESIRPLIDTNRIGHHCALTRLNGQTIGMISDWTTWSVMSFAEQSDGRYRIQVVDRPLSGQRRILGGSPQLTTTALGQVVAIYQEGSNNNLMLNVYDGQEWAPDARTIIGEGAVGFSNRMLIDGDRIVIGTVELATQVGNRENSRIRLIEIQSSQL
ncbi:MAG: dickkopf-related protein [Myxococcota bacterium]|nr:dickkopf-related protein [Myxococcota bacterium]